MEVSSKFSPKLLGLFHAAAVHVVVLLAVADSSVGGEALGDSIFLESSGAGDVWHY